MFASPNGAAPDYIGSEKCILHRCIRERGTVLTPDAGTRLDSLPEMFRDFLIEPREWNKPQDGESLRIIEVHGLTLSRAG